MVVGVEGVLVQVARLLAETKAERIEVQLSAGARLIVEVSTVFVDLLAQITPVVRELCDALIELASQHVRELFQLRLVLEVRNSGFQRPVAEAARIGRTARSFPLYHPPSNLSLLGHQLNLLPN